MARKREDPKPLLAFKKDFYDSLDNVIQQSILLIQTVEMTIDHGAVKEPTLDFLKERLHAFRKSIFAED